MVWHIYVQKDVAISKWQQRTIAVRTTWPNLPPKAVDWASETSEVSPGITNYGSNTGGRREFSFGSLNN